MVMNGLNRDLQGSGCLLFTNMLLETDAPGSYLDAIILTLEQVVPIIPRRTDPQDLA